MGDSLESNIALAKSNGWYGLLVGERARTADGLAPDYWAQDLESAMIQSSAFGARR